MNARREASKLEESQAQNIKQVIVMRHDLKMRRGKQIAQGAHASMSFLTRRLQSQSSINVAEFSANVQNWLMGSFAKVCVRCNSEEELMAIHDKAMALGLEVHLITDSGRTEFHGQPTRTCLAIGPDDASKIDEVTGHLELL
jgi:PTH2 family peptidyl-tRNA hydrolase